MSLPILPFSLESVPFAAAKSATFGQANLLQAKPLLLLQSRTIPQVEPHQRSLGGEQVLMHDRIFLFNFKQVSADVAQDEPSQGRVAAISARRGTR